MVGNKILKEESGAALLIALMVMTLLTLIVLCSAFTSVFEVKLGGNKRASATAFYAAEGGVQAVIGNIANFDLTGKYVNNKYTPFAESHDLNPTNAAVVIEHLPDQKGAPRGSGMSAINFGFQHFAIGSTGEDQLESGSGRSSCEIEEKVVRLIPTEQGGY